MLPYAETLRLIRAGGDLLNLPSRATCTALVFAHRFYHAGADHEDIDSERLASTCLFIASKVEEASLRTNDLLNAVRWLHCQPTHPWGRSVPESLPVGEGGVEAAPAAASGSAAEAVMLVGDAYYAAKSRLIMDEQLVLRLLRFDIGVEQPHKFCYCFAKTVQAEERVVRLATCLLNDSLANSDACLTQPPKALAAAALHVAAGLAAAPLPQPRSGGSWWEVLGVATEAVAASCALLEGMLAEAQAA